MNVWVHQELELHGGMHWDMCAVKHLFWTLVCDEHATHRRLDMESIRLLTCPHKGALLPFPPNLCSYEQGVCSYDALRNFFWPTPMMT